MYGKFCECLTCTYEQVIYSSYVKLLSVNISFYLVFVNLLEGTP
jgi:hypothetical protein